MTDLKNENKLLKEENLIEQLKQSCGPDKKEINPRMSAHIIHKLGLVYRQKSPHRLSLLQSAVLLNAAIKRNPHPDFVDDLRRLCSEILKLSNAQMQDANLLQISKEIYDDLCRMRTDLENNLDNLVVIPDNLNNEEFEMLETLKIKEVKDMQNKVTEDFLDILKKASKATIDILGKPPCKFALIGMGSLARKEVTLFSDFENVIVLQDEIEAENYQEVLEYFRWFSTIVLLILINFGEMIIPFAAIPTISNKWFFDYLPLGICPDGFDGNASKNAIGRQMGPNKSELIKTAGEMAECLDDKNDEKNGVHFARILAKNCFVYGDVEVYKEFKGRCQRKLIELRKQNTDFFSQVAKNFEECNALFGVVSYIENILLLGMVDVKRAIYRTISMFLSLIARCYDLKSISSFEIVSELVKKGLINPDDARKLEFAVAISCEVRQKVYSKEKSQHDYLEMKMDDDNFVGTTGPTSIAKCFAAISSFQRSLKLNENGQITFAECIYTSNRLLKSEQHGYFGVKYYQKAIDFTLKVYDLESSDLNEAAYNLTFIALCYFNMGQFKKSTLYFQRSVVKYLEITSYSLEISKCYDMLSINVAHTHGFSHALHYQLKNLEVLQNIEINRNNFDKLVNCCSQIGSGYFMLNIPEKSVEYYRLALQKHLEFCKDENFNSIKIEVDLSSCLGSCLTRVKNQEEALQMFQKELELRKKVADGSEISKELTKVELKEWGNETVKCCLQIAGCLNALGRKEEARIYIQEFRKYKKSNGLSHIKNLNLYTEIFKNRKTIQQREMSYIKSFVIYKNKQ